MLRRYAEIGADVAIAWVAFQQFGWIGLALWALFVISWFATQLISNQQIINEDSAFTIAKSVRVLSPRDCGRGWCFR